MKNATLQSVAKALTRAVLPLRRAPLGVPRLASKPAQPIVYAFPADYGDSTLIRYGGINILIDGGVSSNNPCFWPVVSRLPDDEKLDVVILTHQDTNHLTGIKRLVEFAPDGFLGSVYCLKPFDKEEKYTPVTQATYGGADVWTAALKKGCACPLKAGKTIDVGRGNIKLQLLAPNDVAADRARPLDEIAHNRPQPRQWYCLLPGDPAC